MQDTNQPQILSVKELNKVLDELQKDKKIASLGTFSQIDIVFVAGLLLRYMQHKDNWIKIPHFFNLTENDNAWNHSHYFKQINELYNVSDSDIFENFPKAHNVNANSFSRFFVPPIYITKKSIDNFFDYRKSDELKNKWKSLFELKKKYYSSFDILDFVDIRVKTYKTNEQKFKEYAAEIQQRLKTVPPVFVFVFIVACKRLAKKENRTFEKTKDYVEKIWLFTQTYINGLHELAKNIVEHSGQGENDGQGMITVRAYSGTNNDNEKIKVLETHVFDYGEKGIYETLKQNTAKNQTGEENDVYTRDLEVLTDSKNKYTISDFIDPTDNQKFLLQQFYREMAHYGLMNFKNLIEQYDGIMITSSVRNEKENENNRERYVFSVYNITDEEIRECDITKGTSYYFEMPFIPASFEEKTKNEMESSNQHTVLSLSNLQNVELVEYADTDTLRQTECKKYLINFKVSDYQKEINNRAVENGVCKDIIDKLNSQQITEIKNRYIALDFDGVTLNKSNLLRILARLSREKISDFIVYNIHCEIYIGLIKDNEQWFEKTKDKRNYVDNQKRIDVSYWFKDKSILFFTRYEKTQEIEGEQQKDYFYFADFLFGDTPKTFNSINKIVSNTFPNTTCINKKEQEFDIDDNFSIPQKLQDNFFYGKSKYLMPFDTLLKSKEHKTNVEKELFLFNIKTIIQNKLFGRGTYYNIADYVDNFEGYHIAKTHFKIGNKVHSSDFYYAKRLFQNSRYTTRLAMNLAKKINDSLDETRPITLVGYEIYSELILSLIEKFLRDIYKYASINHFVAQSEDNKWDFLSKDTFNSYMKEYDKRETIIIVPIAATGSTARKIKEEIRNRIYQKVKVGKSENEKIAEDAKNNYCFFDPTYNIILAQDARKDLFKDEINEDKNEQQKPIISLMAKWYKIKDCDLCYNKDKSKPLFDTDNSSLTPSLIFENPEGLTKSNVKNEVENPVAKFNDLLFDNSIGYQSVSRNDNYRIYNVDSDRFIDANRDNIVKWLEFIKNYLENNVEDKLKPTDNVVIVAPCHESNSKFLNLINEYVFSSAATIIHHQNSVDFVENFSLLNKSDLNRKNTKVFYVDDSLITGANFFKLFDLIRKVADNDSPLTASILINDQTIPFIHDRAVRWSNNYFAFSIYNQPPTLNILKKRPLEHERIRYESLKESTLHDILCEHFHEKANKLCPEKRSPEKEESIEKQIRRLKMFEATHKVYDYFGKNREASVPNLANEEGRKTFVEFKLKFDNKGIKIDESDMNRKALMKVLSQYPFILYKDLREATFEWHKKMLECCISYNDRSVFKIDEDYDKDFSTFKFLLRRAAFLGNYQVLKKDFLEKLLMWFVKIDQYIEENKSKFDNNDQMMPEEKKLRDFPVFVLGNYAEMVQKNGWVAYHILEAIKEVDFKQSKQGRQFYNMLQIETATIIDEFMGMINKDYRFKWRDMYNKEDDPTKLYCDTDKIVSFFKERPDLRKTNKYKLVKEILFMDRNCAKKLVPFVNYLWIKQLLYDDCIDKNPHIPKEIKYQEKIDEIIKKMKGLFPDKEVKSFFIVTDGQQIPHIISKENKFLDEFTYEFQTSKENKSTNNLKTKEIIDFLNGKLCNSGNVTETTAEFVFDENTKKWTNIYTHNDTIKLDFLPPDTKWLYLIRISKLKEDKKDGNCDFETQGLLGFYNKDKKIIDNILPKKLLMLLRRDMSEFINKHHKNDEFSEYIKSQEKIKEAMASEHGFNTIVKRLGDMVNNHFSTCRDFAFKKDFDYLHSLIANKEPFKKVLTLGKIVDDSGGMLTKTEFNVKEEIEQTYRLIFDYRKYENINYKRDIEDNLSTKFYLNVFRAVLYEYLKNANTCLFELSDKVELFIKAVKVEDCSSDLVEITITNKAKSNFENLSNHREQLKKYGYCQKDTKGLYKSSRLLHITTDKYPQITFCEKETDDGYFDFTVKFKI